MTRTWYAWVTAICLAWGSAGGAQDATLPIPDLRHITDENRTQIAEQSVQYLRAVRASDVERGLPAVRFDRWLEGVLRLPALWEMTDCSIPRREGHGPYCIRISQASRGVDLLVVIGTDERGVGRPQLLSAGIRLFDIDSAFEDLSQLPDLLNEAEARRQRFADHPMRSMSEADLAVIRHNTRAATLHRALPDEPLEGWLRRAVGDGIPIAWTLTSCSPAPNAAAPQCVNVDVRWPDGARARVLLDLEMVQRGLASEPAFRVAFLYRGDTGGRVQPYASLQEFGEALRAFAAPRP
ncbi:MAG: hypothetical protein AB7N65_29945 [Vicinamibacterales bacterium]